MSPFPCLASTALIWGKVCELSQSIFLTRWRHGLFNYDWQRELCSLSLPWPVFVGHNTVYNGILWSSLAMVSSDYSEHGKSRKLWNKGISGPVGTETGDHCVRVMGGLSDRRLGKSCCRLRPSNALLSSELSSLWVLIWSDSFSLGANQQQPFDGAFLPRKSPKWTSWEHTN